MRGVMEESMTNIELLTKEDQKEEGSPFLTADQVKQAIKAIKFKDRPLTPDERQKALNAKLTELFANCQSFNHEALACAEEWIGQKVRGEYHAASLLPD